MDDASALLLTDNLNTGWIGAKRADIPLGGTVAVSEAAPGVAVSATLPVLTTPAQASPAAAVPG